MSWSELDQLVGGLPRSAYDHAAFWKGYRTGWPEFTTIDVHVGETVTFVRRGPDRPPRQRRTTPAVRSPDHDTTLTDVVLVGCVKSKLERPAPARDLYTSALFRKERAYAEATGTRWFVLSAEYGLVEPERVIDPYELHLSSTTRDYRADWGKRVVDELTTHLGDLRVDDASTLDGIETEVLAALDPPLNLAKMPKSAVRARLKQLRRRHQ